MTKEADNIKSRLITLQDIIKEEYCFNIPNYQRLYVWGHEQISTLLTDLQTAFEEKQDIFYLGGVLVQETESKRYDLIDGQQRFTTLWLLSLVLKEHLADFVKVGEDLRMSFSIRQEVTAYFKKYIYSDDKGNDQTIPPTMRDALALIEGLSVGDNNSFTEFVRDKIKFVFTEVPQNTDLNKLFEIINNRGIQLQHHEILKARLLNNLPVEDRLKYSYLWNACAQMDRYVEKNIKDIASISISDLFNNEAYEEGTEALGSPVEILKKMEQLTNGSFTSLTLASILTEVTDNMKQDTTQTNNKKDDEKYGSYEVRSIISFPMLLLHTLRIFLFQKKKDDISRILDKDLLKIFDDCGKEELFTKENTQDFLHLLWRVRYLFDKHIIKWVRKEGAEHEEHRIMKLYKQEDKYVVRQWEEGGNKDEEILQSMLYHSQQITTHYWLTPLLYHLLENKGKDSYQYLQHLDNHLFCSNEAGSLIVRTRKFLEKPQPTTPLVLDALNEASGTDFSHYWFYKLEYVLFIKRNEFAPKGRQELWGKYRITAKNSVEHISPQNPQSTDTNKVSESVLNTFGNLALVTRSINSSYSNLPFNEKRQRFENNNKDKVDSLKMDIIYQSEQWNDKLAQAHQEKMIEVLTDYIKSTNS